MKSESIFEEWKNYVFDSFLNIPAYFRQRSLILKNPDLIFEDRRKLLTINSSVDFALRSLLLFSAIFTLLTWLLITFLDVPPPNIEKIIENPELSEYQQILESTGIKTVEELKKIDRVKRFYESINFIFIGLGLILTAYLFKWRFIKYASVSPKILQADRAYLYWVSARLFWPSAISTLGEETFKFMSRFEFYMTFVFDNFLPAIFFTLCAVWGIVALVRSAPVLSRILEVDKINGQKKGVRMTIVTLILSSLTIGALLFLLKMIILYFYSIKLNINVEQLISL